MVPFVPQEVIEAIREAVVYLAHTHDGARVAMHCLWHGTPKVSAAVLGLSFLRLSASFGLIPAVHKQLYLCKVVSQGLAAIGLLWA